MNRDSLEELLKEAPALLTILAVSTAIVGGIALGIVITDKALRYFIESLI